MTDLLCNWLNDSLGLSVKLTGSNIECNFASGYLFGEVFQKLNLKSNLDDLKKGTAVDVAIHNFAVLEPVFRSLQLPLSAIEASDVITLKPGAALKLLNYIRVKFHQGVSYKTLSISEKKKLFENHERERFLHTLRQKLSLSHAKSKGEAIKLPPLSRDHKTEVSDKTPELGEAPHEVYHQDLSARLKVLEASRQNRSKFFIQTLRSFQQKQRDIVESNLKHILDEWRIERERDVLLLQKKLDSINAFVEVMTSNDTQARAILFQQKEKDLNLEADHCRTSFASINKDYLRDIGAMEAKLRQVQRSYQLSKRQKHAAFCRSITMQLVGFAIELSDLKQRFDNHVPAQLMREVKVKFFNGSLFGVKVQAQVDAGVSGSDHHDTETADVASVNSAHEVESDAEVALVRQELSDFKSLEGAWKFEHVIKETEYFDGVLNQLKDFATRPEITINMTLLKPTVARIVVTGKYLSGSSAIVRDLALACKLRVVNPSTLVDEVLTSGNKDDELSAKEFNLAETIHQSLLQGNPGDQTALNELVATRLKKLTPNTGWILVDYPKTRTQAAELEKLLTGYEEPKKPVKKPAGKKKGDSEFIQSYFDRFIVIDADDDVVIKRGLGRVMDPSTNTAYHIEFDPPPMERELLSRLVRMPEDSVDIASSIAVFKNNVDGIKEWLSRFEGFKEFDGNVSLSEIRCKIEEDILELSKKNSAEHLTEPIVTEQSSVRLTTPIAKVLLNTWLAESARIEGEVLNLLLSIRKETAVAFSLFEDFIAKFKSKLDADSLEGCKLYQDIKSGLQTASASQDDQNYGDFKERLWKQADAFRESADAEKMGILQQKIFETPAFNVSSKFAELFKVEADMFAVNLNLLLAFGNEVCRIIPPFALAEPFKTPAQNTPGSADDSSKKIGAKKKVMPSTPPASASQKKALNKQPSELPAISQEGSGNDVQAVVSERASSYIIDNVSVENSEISEAFRAEFQSSVETLKHNSIARLNAIQKNGEEKISAVLNLQAELADVLTVNIGLKYQRDMAATKRLLLRF